MELWKHNPAVPCEEYKKPNDVAAIMSRATWTKYFSLIAWPSFQSFVATFHCHFPPPTLARSQLGCPHHLKPPLPPSYMPSLCFFFVSLNRLEDESGSILADVRMLDWLSPYFGLTILGNILHWVEALDLPSGTIAN